MSAFLAYGGAYEFGGDRYRWRCYATARIHAVRRLDHGPFPRPPAGLKWIALQPRHRSEPELSCLLDETVHEFSHMLVQIEPSLELAAH